MAKMAGNDTPPGATLPTPDFICIRAQFLPAGWPSLSNREGCISNTYAPPESIGFEAIAMVMS
jgi:hypothetical protein